MHKHLKVVLCVSMLMASGACKQRGADSLVSIPPPPPQPPKEALEPCRLQMATVQADGTMAASDSLSLSLRSDTEIVSCDMKRQLLIDAWPRYIVPTPVKKK